MYMLNASFVRKISYVIASELPPQSLSHLTRLVLVLVSMILSAWIEPLKIKLRSALKTTQEDE